MIKPTLNLMVVPGWVEVKPEDPNRDVVPPNGLEVVLVVPNNPPLLVLVPKAAKYDRQCKKNRFHRIVLLYLTPLRKSCTELTAERSGFIGAECISLLREKASAACISAPKEAVRSSTACGAESKPAAGGRGDGLIEGAGAKKPA